jgi:hypothetical protein
VQANDDIFRTWRDPDADEIAHWAPAVLRITDFRRVATSG